VVAVVAVAAVVVVAVETRFPVERTSAITSTAESDLWVALESSISEIWEALACQRQIPLVAQMVHLQVDWVAQVMAPEEYLHQNPRALQNLVVQVPQEVVAIKR